MGTQVEGAAVAAEDRKLARGPQGEAVITEDSSGTPRYVFRDGSMDLGSGVEMRSPHLRVVNFEGLVAQEVLLEAGVALPVAANPADADGHLPFTGS